MSRLQGAVVPIVTPFIDNPKEYYPVDYVALANYVKFLIDNGVKNIMVASVTSRFAQLDLDEIMQINQIVIDAAGKKATTIASTPMGGTTKQHIEVAKHAESCGADVLVCDYPWRFQSMQGLLNYFEALLHATTSIHLMLHITPIRSELGGSYRYDLESLSRIFDLPRMIGMKEASGDLEHSKAIWQALAHKTSIIVAGGGGKKFLQAYPYGIAGYFVGVGNVAPQIGNQIYEFAEQGLYEKARNIVEQYEIPFLTEAVKYGWHASLKVALAEMGLMNVLERPPMHSLTFEQRSSLRLVMQQCGLLDLAII